MLHTIGFLVHSSLAINSRHNVFNLSTSNVHSGAKQIFFLSVVRRRKIESFSLVERGHHERSQSLQKCVLNTNMENETKKKRRKEKIWHCSERGSRSQWKMHCKMASAKSQQRSSPVCTGIPFNKLLKRWNLHFVAATK